MSRQRAFLPPPGQARPDWRVIADVAARMGWGDAFAWSGPATVFREHAGLSGIAGRMELDFDISALADLSDAGYEALAPVQWPLPRTDRGSGRFLAEGGFYTADHRARMVAAASSPDVSVSADYPLRLNTGRVRDPWHTMTRTAKSPRLSQHTAEPFAEIHLADATALRIRPAELVTIRSAHGRMVARALVSGRTPEGSVFVPMHWTSGWAACGRSNVAVTAKVDPISGQPALNYGAIRVEPFAASWYAFAASAVPLAPTGDYWALARTGPNWRAELARKARPANWEAYACGLSGLPGARTISMIDRARCVAHIALLSEGRVSGILFAAPTPVAVNRAHVVARLDAEDAADTLLSGRPGRDRPDPGPTICACFAVGVNTILTAIAEQELADVEAIGRAVRAGTNCGS